MTALPAALLTSLSAGVRTSSDEAGKHVTGDGSAFDAILGSVGGKTSSSDETNASGANQNSSAQRSFSLAPRLGSGVLALHETVKAAKSQTDKSSQLSKGADGSAPTSASPSPDASVSLANAALAGLTQAVAPVTDSRMSAADAAAKGSDAAASTAAATISSATGAIERTLAMPSDSSAPVAVTPVAVSVKRSITYLGLNPTLRERVNAEAPSTPAVSAKAAVSAEATLSGNRVSAASVSSTTPTTSSSAAIVPAQMALGDHNSSGARSGGSGSGSQHDKSAVSVAAGSVGDPDASSAAAAVAQSSYDSTQGVAIGQLASVIANVASDFVASATPSAPASTAANIPSDAAAARTAPIKELDVEMNPASLGSLSIQMRLSQGKLSVAIAAEKPETVKLIDNERGAIADKLKSLNLSVEDLTVKASSSGGQAASTGGDTNQGATGYGDGRQDQSSGANDGFAGRQASRHGSGNQASNSGSGEASGSGVRDTGDRFL